MKFKNNVAECRKSIGKTQKQLAADVKISETSIQNIEAGIQEPKVTLAQRIAKALSKEVREIFPNETLDLLEQVDSAKE